jgi:hypothetical protein
LFARQTVLPDVLVGSMLFIAFGFYLAWRTKKCQRRTSVISSTHVMIEGLPIATRRQKLALKVRFDRTGNCGACPGQSAGNQADKNDDVSHRHCIG